MKKLFFILSLSISFSVASGQTASSDLICSGGFHYGAIDAQVESLQIDWAIGGCIYEHFIPDGKGNTSTANEFGETIINVYPNPTSDIVNIQFTENFKNYQIKVCDFKGEELINKNCTNINEKIDLSAFANSVYLLNISEKGEIIKTIKIIKSN